jgi:hypothetical protein
MANISSAAHPTPCTIVKDGRCAIRGFDYESGMFQNKNVERSFAHSRIWLARFAKTKANHSTGHLLAFSMVLLDAGLASETTTWRHVLASLNVCFPPPTGQGPWRAGIRSSTWPARFFRTGTRLPSI